MCVCVCVCVCVFVCLCVCDCMHVSSRVSHVEILLWAVLFTSEVVEDWLNLRVHQTQLSDCTVYSCGRVLAM